MFTPTWFIRGGGKPGWASFRLHLMTWLVLCRLRLRRKAALRPRWRTTNGRDRGSKWCCAMAGFCACRKKWRRSLWGNWRMRWTGAVDDPDAGGDADLGGLWGNRHEAWLRWPRHDGARRAEAEPIFRAYFCVPREACR